MTQEQHAGEGKEAMAVGAAKAHPAYSDGYFDGLEGYPMQGKQPPQYEVGYGAGARAAAMFIEAGMERQDDGSFAIRLTIANTPAPTKGDEA